jgi:uncharacterized protein YjbI with pentapeptide repeats
MAAHTAGSGMMRLLRALVMLAAVCLGVLYALGYHLPGLLARAAAGLALIVVAVQFWRHAIGRQGRVRNRARYLRWRTLAIASRSPRARAAGWTLVVILGLVAAAAYAVALWRAPGWEHATTAQDRYDARLLVISVGGAIVVLTGLLYTARNYRLSRRGQVTERFAAALDRLGSSDMYTRIGGIQALDDVIRDSAGRAYDVIGVLNPFMHDRAPGRGRQVWHPVTGSVPDPDLPPEPAADIQAALSVLAYRPAHTERRIINLAGLHLAGADLTKANLSHANLSRADLTRAILTFADLTYADLSRANLSRAADLSRANLSRAADLSRANLTRAADLTGARLTHADLTGADLTDTVLWGADLTDARLTEANLSHANLQSADLTEAKLGDAILTDANLDAANLTHAWLSGANLSHAWLGGGANLTRASLTGANLTGARLTHADLTGAILTGANLTDAILTDANLTDADLLGADLTRANLTRANLSDAHLTLAELTAKVLPGEVLTGVHLTDADLTDADLTDAVWPPDAPVPVGWQRSDTGLLARADPSPGGGPTG